MNYNYKTENTCARSINFDIDNNIVSNVEFIGGCNGNLKAISALVNGCTVEEIETKLKGITCGKSQTSCTDQLANAVRKAFEESK